MAETDWLGMLGGLAGTVGGAYLGTYAGNPQLGAQLGGSLGSSLGSATSQEAGLTEGAGYDPNAMYGSFMGGMGGGGGGGMGGLMGMFGGGGGGGGVGGSPIYRAPTMSTADLFAQAGGMLPGLAGSEVAYNQALQPGLTGVQLNAEQQIAPGTFGLRRDALAARQRDLDLGYRLPPELQDLVLTNALQGLSASGAGASNMGALFGARSLAGAGLDRGEARIANALSASQFRPDYFTPRQPFGPAPGALLAGDIRGVEAMGNQVQNLNVATQAAAQQKQSQDQANAFTSILGQAGQMMKGAGNKNVPLSKDYTGTLGSGQQTSFERAGGIMNFNEGATNYNWNQSSGSNLGGNPWTSSFNLS